MRSISVKLFLIWTNGSDDVLRYFLFRALAGILANGIIAKTWCQCSIFLWLLEKNPTKIDVTIRASPA